MTETEMMDTIEKYMEGFCDRTEILISLSSENGTKSLLDFFREEKDESEFYEQQSETASDIISALEKYGTERFGDEFLMQENFDNMYSEILPDGEDLPF